MTFHAAASRTLCIALLSALSACSSDSTSDLDVRVITDLVAVAEFASVEVQRLTEDGTLIDGDVQNTDVVAGTSFVRGVQVAEFADVKNGGMFVRVRAKDAGGKTVLEQSTRFVLRGDYTLNVYLDRACADVDCSSAGSAPQACYMGQCVDARCNPDDESTRMYCDDAACTSATDCPAAAACATNTCSSGVCIAEQNAETNGGCEAGFYCDVRAEGNACKAIDMPAHQDAGMDANVEVPDASEPMDGTLIDAPLDAPRDARPDAPRDAAPASVCGNGFKERGEACDDSNMIEDDDCSADCTRRTCYVTDEASLTSALADRSCRKVILPARTFTGHYVVSRGVSIRGASADTTIIDTQGMFGRALIINGSENVDVSDIAFTHGGLELYAPTHLTNAKITDVSINDNGGAINANAALQLVNVVVSGNTFNATTTSTTLSGAGLFFSANADLTITNCTFSNNGNTVATTKSMNGGAININQADAVVISNSTFTGNTVISSEGTAAGAIYAYGYNSLDISDTTFRGNSATTTSPGHFTLGGAVQANFDSGVVSLDGCTFENNSVTNVEAAYGGAFYVHGSTTTITDSSFDSNEVYGTHSGGGAAHFQNSNVTITGSTFSNNSVHSTRGFTGGGAVNQSYSNLSMSQSSVRENYVRQQLMTGETSSGALTGGGISSDTGTLSLFQSNIESNYLFSFGANSGTALRGGGVTCQNWMDGDGECSIVESSIVSNSVQLVSTSETIQLDSAGVYAIANSTASMLVRVINSTIGDNSMIDMTSAAYKFGIQVQVGSSGGSALVAHLRNATITGANASTGITIGSLLSVSRSSTSMSSVTFANSILDAANDDMNACNYNFFDSGVSRTSEGHNIISAGCLSTVTSTDLALNGTDSAGLLSLATSSGGVKYYPLDHMSPAIDFGLATGCTDDEGALLSHDSVGHSRFGICDSGAAEYQVP